MMKEMVPGAILVAASGLIYAIERAGAMVAFRELPEAHISFVDNSLGVFLLVLGLGLMVWGFVSDLRRAPQV